MKQVRPSMPTLALLLALGACHADDHSHDDHVHDDDSHPPAEAEPWAVTAWSEHYEVFAETEPLVAGKAAASHAHFTWLPDFSALNEGSVTGVLRDPSGTEQSFHSPAPLRAGIFRVVFEPAREGVFELAFRIAAHGLVEEVAAGRVRVGGESAPGGLETEVEERGGEPIGFLKEQQWRTPFATAVAPRGSLRRSLHGQGRVLPAAGGEVVITAPAEGLVSAARWPHLGLEVARGQALFTLTPRVAAERSPAQLAAVEIELAAEHQAAVARHARLRELLALEAVSRREVEAAEVAERRLAARLEAARRDRAAAEAVRRGAGGAESFRLPAPITGRVAAVLVGPGELVAAGAPLARVVRGAPVWLEIGLRAADAAALAAPPAGLWLRRSAGEEPLSVAADELALVSRAPEVDAATGLVRVLLELRRDATALPLGSRIEVELLLPREIEGIVLPASAVIDDGGREVVYVQLGGESFERREIVVELRQGDRVLVRGIEAGERLVTLGGEAIRRGELLGSGAVEGHVH